MIYYNGYGYNFYYGAYGYYENSPNDKKDNSAAIIGALVTFCCICPIIYCLICKYCGDDDDEIMDSEEIIEERVEVTTVTTHNQGGYRHKDY